MVKAKQKKLVENKTPTSVDEKSEAGAENRAPNNQEAENSKEEKVKETDLEFLDDKAKKLRASRILQLTMYREKKLRRRAASIMNLKKCMAARQQEKATNEQQQPNS